MRQFAWIVKFALRMFTFMTHCGENNFGSNKILFLPLTRIDFAALVSSRAVRISSRAVRVFPALSLRRVRPSYGTFSLMVLQGNCARGRTGHMIKVFISLALLLLIDLNVVTETLGGAVLHTYTDIHVSCPKVLN